jgi:arylsulfatase A-like enzyme
VPAIVSWPGHLPEGVVRGQFCTACDWFPAIAEWTGASRPAATQDGHSLADIARAESVPTHYAAFHWQSGGTAAKPQWAVREGDWKLIGNPDDTSNKAPLTADDALFLANPVSDPSEMTNLAPRHPEIVARLARLHEEWAMEMSRAGTSGTVNGSGDSED